MLSTSERTLKSNGKCWTPPPAAPLIAMLWLTGCAIAGSDVQVPCPPAVEYTTADQARAADEVDALSECAFQSSKVFANGGPLQICLMCRLSKRNATHD